MYICVYWDWGLGVIVIVIVKVKVKQIVYTSQIVTVIGEAVPEKLPVEVILQSKVPIITIVITITIMITITVTITITITTFITINYSSSSRARLGTTPQPPPPPPPFFNKYNIGFIKCTTLTQYTIHTHPQWLCLTNQNWLY